MSLGYCGKARKYSEDDLEVIFEYSVENWNEPFGHKGDLFDGLICINKSAMPKAEIHEKIKRMPSGRKRLVTKKLLVPPELGQMLVNGDLKIVNSSRCWKTVFDDADYYAVILCCRISEYYQEHDAMPEKMGFIQ